MAVFGHDLKQALKYGSTMPYRWALALGSTLYGILTLAGPDSSYGASQVLSSGWRCGWGAVFLLDAFCLWWRIFDGTPRRWWGLGINLATMALWGSILGGTAAATGYLSPGLTGYVVLLMMALHVFWRTEFTVRDKDTV